MIGSTREFYVTYQVERYRQCRDAVFSANIVDAPNHFLPDLFFFCNYRTTGHFLSVIIALEEPVASFQFVCQLCCQFEAEEETVLCNLICDMVLCINDFQHQLPLRLAQHIYKLPAAVINFLCKFRQFRLCIYASV